MMENLGLRTADAFPFVASLPPKLFFGAREATTGNTSSAVRRLTKGLQAVVLSSEGSISLNWSSQRPL